MEQYRFAVMAAQAEDMETLSRLMVEYISCFYKKPLPAIPAVHSHISMLLERTGGIQFVAVHQDELVGFATLYFTYSTLRLSPVTVMNDLYVVEGYRGKGAAAALFEACKTYTYDNGYASMSWVTAEDNYRAQRFYEKMGGTLDTWNNYSI